MVISYTINEFLTKNYNKVYEVYDYFKHYFGEEYVDLQGLPSNDSIINAFNLCGITSNNSVYTAEESVWENLRWSFSTNLNIIIWWPEVTVTNENNKFVKIYDLYAKVTVDTLGRFYGTTFTLLRATYPEIQWLSKYQHSHVPRLRSLPIWEIPCLGRGPIQNTISHLKYDNREEYWLLFCDELAKYVTVESLRGGPYIRLETIGEFNNTIGSYCGYIDTLGYSYLNRFKTRLGKDTWNNIIKEFLKYYLNNGHLDICYRNNVFKISNNYYNLVLDMSSSFIEWFNIYGNEELKTKLYNAEILKTAVPKNGRFYSKDSLQVLSQNAPTSILLYFKNEPIYTKIIKKEKESVQTATLLDHNIILYFFHYINTIINYHYGNKQIEQSTDTTTSSINKTVCYI